MLQCTNWNISHECFSHITSCLESFFSYHVLSVCVHVCVKARFLRKMEVQNGLCCSRCCIQCSNHIREIRNHFLFVSISSRFFYSPLFSVYFYGFCGSFVGYVWMSLFLYGVWRMNVCINWNRIASVWFYQMVEWTCSIVSNEHLVFSHLHVIWRGEGGKGEWMMI